jgi:uncharacterized protein
MTVPGIVTNITNFGVFVDIGVKQDGLVHISQLSNTYVSDPNSVVKLQQKVMVTIMEVDIARKRISLSMKGNAAQGGAGRKDGGSRGQRGAEGPGHGGPKRPGQDAGRKTGTRSGGRGEAAKEKRDEEQKESAEDFQAKLLALKKKFK